MPTLSVGTPQYYSAVGSRYVPNPGGEGTPAYDPLGILSAPGFDMAKSPYYSAPQGEGGPTPNVEAIGRQAVSQLGLTPQQVAQNIWGGQATFPDPNTIQFPDIKSGFGDFLESMVPLAASAFMFGAPMGADAATADAGLGELGINTALPQSSVTSMGGFGGTAAGIGDPLATNTFTAGMDGMSFPPGTTASTLNLGNQSIPLTGPGGTLAGATGVSSGSAAISAELGLPTVVDPNLGSPGRAPVDERGRPYDPSTAGGPPAFSNVFPGLANMAFEGQLGGGGGLSLASLFSGGSSSFGGPLGGITSLFDIGTGLYGLEQSRKLKQIAQQAFQSAQDPNTAQYRQQLAALMADPSSVASMPGYQFGMDQGRQAIARSGAAGGSGGNEAIALARYTPEYAMNYYNSAVNNLANLSRGVPAAGSLLVQGNEGAMQLAANSLNRLGYGAARGVGRVFS